MQTLSNVPFKDLRIGDMVRSKRTNIDGRIIKLIDIENAIRKEDNEIMVQWDHGGISYQWCFNYCNVWLI